MVRKVFGQMGCLFIRMQNNTVTICTIKYTYNIKLMKIA